jgi:hypothetical protein
VFRNGIEDVVGSRLIDPGGPDAGDETYLRENIGELEVLGAFARLRAPRRPGVPVEHARSARVTYGQQFSDFVDPLTGEKTFDDVPGQRIPPLHGWLALRYDVGPGWLGWLEVGTAWAFEQDRLSPQDLRSGSARTRGGSSACTNVLDEEYRIHGSGFDAPGIGLVVGARWNR